jgi:hypothetical protein
MEFQSRSFIREFEVMEFLLMDGLKAASSESYHSVQPAVEPRQLDAPGLAAILMHNGRALIEGHFIGTLQFRPSNTCRIEVAGRAKNSFFPR